MCRSFLINLFKVEASGSGGGGGGGGVEGREGRRAPPPKRRASRAPTPINSPSPEPHEDDVEDVDRSFLHGL